MNTHPKQLAITLLLAIAVCSLAFSPARAETNLVPVAKAWAKTSVNAVIFRKNSIVSDKQSQYIAFYNDDANVVLGKRKLGTSDWELKTTPYGGNARDAHNAISIMLDGDGYLHMSWDHHGHPLRYVKSVKPGSLDLTDMLTMTGQFEEKVTYPEFLRLRDGNLLFLYRDGGSGRGNLILNLYDTKTKQWSSRQPVLVDGEGERNAYWQACTDSQGTLHLSWCWRITGDIATNHDLCYAKSPDGGFTWQRPTGEAQPLPITAANAEYVARIPTGSELINHCSMSADGQGRPYIATYFQAADAKAPEYQVVFNQGTGWQTEAVSKRTTPFQLSGVGTKSIPMSRPQIVAESLGDATTVYFIFRDEERGNRISIAICNDLKKGEWQIQDLTEFSVDRWEPSFDTERWRLARELHIYAQEVHQGDGEKTIDLPPTLVNVLEWKP